MTRAVLSLGANLGDRAASLQSAVDALGEHSRILAVSPVYQTSPMGGPAQPDFLNAVVVVEADDSAAALLAWCQEIELLAGRVRGERWGPRVLDIDIITFGDLASDDPTLTLPHPRASERAFVLVPWLDVDPTAQLGGSSVAELIRVVGTAGLTRRDELTLVVPSGCG
ncbi:MAG TPA: 2-amino-4-hydroxy-6-hydroxymethyldihydropteridine diphosphokinase [Mycobacteriales bacterium]|nr:2-amino-4-hydroxy-6-hydroxymethyldihydropteridine diphosphokinase [Mycobacteriales bacterium]